MNRELFEQAIRESGELSLEDATQRALLFHKFIVLSNDPEKEDTWFQVSDNWDINIWQPSNEGPVCATMYPCIKGEDGFFHTDTNAECIRVVEDEPFDFPVLKQELIEFLDKFGERESRGICTGKISGEFCYAEYDYSDEEDIIFSLKYGKNDGDENSLYTDEFRISIYDFKNCKTFEEKYNAVQES
jgi:hypothetical protein